MVLQIILSVLFILSLGLAMKGGQINKMALSDRPQAYHSEIVRALLNLSTFVFLIVAIILFIMNWKLALVLLILSLLSGAWLVAPIAEKVCLYPLLLLEQLLQQKGKK